MNKIILQKQRNFSEKISATFDFIRQEFKPFYRAIFFIVGPLIFISAVTTSYFSLEAMKLGFSGAAGDIDAMLDLYAQMAVPYVLNYVVHVANVVIIYSYMKLYKEGVEDITVDRVFQEVKKNFFMIIGANIVYALVVFVSMFFLLVPALIFGIYLVLLNPIIINEDSNIGDGFSRCFKLMKGKWWSTFGLLVIVGIITTVISYIFAIPSGILSLIWGMNSIDNFQNGTVSISETEQTIFVIVTTATSLLTYFAYAIPNVAIGFQYYNLLERAEATGLMGEIDQMGSGKTDEEESY